MLPKPQNSNNKTSIKAMMVKARVALPAANFMCNPLKQPRQVYLLFLELVKQVRLTDHIQVAITVHRHAFGLRCALLHVANTTAQ